MTAMKIKLFKKQSNFQRKVPHQQQQEKNNAWINLIITGIIMEERTSSLKKFVQKFTKKKK